MEYRQFKLLNTSGAEYDLCDTRHFLSSPDGLGFTKDFDSLQIGSAFVCVDNKLGQQKVTGEIIFADYQEYSLFARFIDEDYLTLAYQPALSDVWYYRSCRIESVKKSEISRATGRLHCNIDILCFSQWYESEIASRTTNLINDTFPLEFPFMFVDSHLNEIYISNPNVYPAPCKIEISGPCTNPGWTLIHNGSVVSDGAVAVTLAKGEKLIVDANVESMRIVKSVGETEISVYQNSDFSTDRFIYAPTGKSKICFTHSSDELIEAVVEVRTVADTV